MSILFPQSVPLPPWSDAVLQGRQCPCGPFTCVAAWATVVWPWPEVRAASDALPVRAPVMAAPALFRRCLRSEPPLRLTAELSPQLGQPSLQCGAAMWSKWGWSISLAQAGAGTQGSCSKPVSCLRGSNTPSYVALGVSTRACGPHASLICASHSPPAGPTGPPTSQGSSSSLCWTPGLGCPTCGLKNSLPGRISTHVISLVLWAPSQGYRSWPDGVSSFPTQFRLSYSLCCMGVFLLVSSENCSTCRCVFDVYMVWGEFHIPLLHHLDQPIIFERDLNIKENILHIYPCSQYFSDVLPWCRSIFPSDIILLLSGRYPLTLNIVRIFC